MAGKFLRWLLGIVVVAAVLVVGAGIWLALSEPLPREAGGWRLGPPMPVARGELATAVASRPGSCGAGACLAVVSGLTGVGEVLDTLRFYDPRRDRWQVGPDLPQPRHHAAAAGLDGALYLAGGVPLIERPWQGEANLWRLGPDSDSWEILEPMPQPRLGHRLVAHDGRLYVVGGRGSGAEVLIYDPDQGWSTGAAMPEPRDHVSAVVVNDEIWAIGGRSPASVARVDIYDPDADRWRPGPDLPEPTSGAAEGVVDGRIFVYGGEEPDLLQGQVNDRHWVLDPGAEKPGWEPARAPPLAVHGADGAVVDGRMMIAGGAARHGLMSIFGWTPALQIRTAE